LDAAIRHDPKHPPEITAALVALTHLDRFRIDAHLGPCLGALIACYFCQASDHPRCGIALAGHASVEHQFPP
jgi:hypothetical protein